MITKLLLDGALKLVQVIKHETGLKTARIYNPREAVPEKILYEDYHQENIFHDEVDNRKYLYTQSGMIPL